MQDRPRLRVHRRHHRVDPDLGPARRGLHRARRRRRHQDDRRRRQDRQDAVGVVLEKLIGQFLFDKAGGSGQVNAALRAAARTVAAVAATALLAGCATHRVAGRPAGADEPRDVRRPRGRRRQRDAADRAGLRRLRAGARCGSACPTSTTTSTTSSPASTACCRASWRRPATISAGCWSTRCSGWAASSTRRRTSGIERGNEDFGQTFAYWGLPVGPYLFVPLFGPTTVVDAQRRPSCASSGVPVGSIPDVPLRNSLYGLGYVEPARGCAGRELDRRHRGARPLPLHPQCLPAAPPLPRLRRQAAAGTRGRIDDIVDCNPLRASPRSPASRPPGSRSRRRSPLAQEAPDALVKRVSQEVLQIVRTDPLVQAGNEARIHEVIEVKLLPQLRLRPDDVAGDGPELAHGHARAAEAPDRGVPHAAGAHLFGRAQPVPQRDRRLQAAAREPGRHRGHRAHRGREAGRRRRCRSTTAWRRRPTAGRRTTSSSPASRWSPTIATSSTRRSRPGGIDGLLKTLADKNKGVAAK